MGINYALLLNRQWNKKHDFLEGGRIKFLKTILHGRDAILRVRAKWLISNVILRLWADVKYHVPTGFGFFAEGERFLSI